jgi:3alpha(or 20beta)-hydroxysteroid dehydrogenase
MSTGLDENVFYFTRKPVTVHNGRRETLVGRLDGKVALITGGARGMGKSHARHFVAEGARVVITDVLDDKGAYVADKLGEDVCRFVHHDVTSEEDWAGAIAATLTAFGRLDVLVNNAGVLVHARIAELSLAQFRQVIDVNLVGCFLGVRSAIAPMSEAGGGSIINISSIEGLTGAAGLSAYSASKFGIRGITKAAAQELGPLGIRVNSVHPGGVMTQMAMAAAASFNTMDAEAFVKAMPIPRFAEPIEISRLVAFLASDEASYSTGSEFTADGGILSGPGY